jgi:hypothetical protein
VAITAKNFEPLMRSKKLCPKGELLSLSLSLFAPPFGGLKLLGLGPVLFSVHIG